MEIGDIRVVTTDVDYINFKMGELFLIIGLNGYTITIFKNETVEYDFTVGQIGSYSKKIS